jgi:hypothetical protein
MASVFPETLSLLTPGFSALVWVMLHGSWAWIDYLFIYLFSTIIYMVALFLEL